MKINIWDANKEVVEHPCHATPYMTFHKAENSVGKCVLILPGGGYSFVCDTYEGEEVAEFFNSFGVNAFVLRYRIAPDFPYPYPFLDATRAMRYIRANASEFEIDPNKLGIMGFSAGGHLASWVSTKFDDILGDDDLIGKVSARPDFTILGYPVINLKQITPYPVTGQNLLGLDASDDTINSLCSEKNITKDTPPAFLFHTFDDQAVPCENSVRYYLGLIKNNIPSELHVYKPGQHGVGLIKDDKHLGTWHILLKNWLLNIV